MSAQDRCRLTLEISDTGEGSVEGVLRADGREHAFSGWLELIATIEDALAGRRPSPAGSSREANT